MVTSAAERQEVRTRSAPGPPPGTPREPRLRGALRALLAICLALAAVEAGLFAGSGDQALALGALVPLALGGVLLLALALLRRRRVEACIHTLAAALYAGAAAYSVALPGAFMSLALLPVVVVAIGLPYLRGAALLRLTALAWLGGMAVLAYNVAVPAPTALPGAWFRFAAYGAVAGFTLVLLTHFSARLQETLAETRAAHEALRRLDAQKVQFLSATAHELRTPMTPVMAQLHLLREGAFGDMNEKQRHAVEVLDRNLVRLNLLVEDVLDVARLQAGRLRLLKERVDLRQALGEAAESFRPAAAAGEVALEVEVPDGLEVEADPRRLAQVLDNLLGNALKFTPPGGRVVVHAEAAGNEAMVRVADSGAGIAAEDLPLLFQPFTQLHGTESKPGAGLGLYVCRGIVEGHGGHIAGESAGPGQGATFTVRWPLAASFPRAPAAPGAVTSRASAGSPRAPASR